MKSSPFSSAAAVLRYFASRLATCRDESPDETSVIPIVVEASDRYPARRSAAREQWAPGPSLDNFS